MAEEGIGSNGLKTKLIVNYLPQQLTDPEFRNLFEAIGPLNSSRVMRDRASEYSYGYGFIDFIEPGDAVAAIDKLNGHRLGHKTLRVAYSKPPGSQKNTNLHVTGLGDNCDEKTLEALFKPHGELVQVKVLRNQDGSSKGVGFVLFKEKDHADVAIRTLQGYADGYGMNLQIHYAKENTEQQRNHPKYQEFMNSKFFQQAQAFNGNQNYGQNYGDSSFDGGNFNQNQNGNNYGGGYGMPMEYTSQNNMQGAQKMQPGRPGAGQRYNPIARPMGQSSMGGNMGMSNNGAINLFAYNIGPEATEGDVYALFSRFGRITKVQIIEGKGYAFVHMPVPFEANEAMQNLNGQPYNGKTLQVSIKSDKKK